MAWGIFNKIATGVKKVADVVGNQVMPVARKVIDTVKPMFEGTKIGKIIEKSDDILSYGEDIKEKVNKISGNLTGKNMYNSKKLMKPQFYEDDEDDYE